MRTRAGLLACLTLLFAAGATAQQQTHTWQFVGETKWRGEVKDMAIAGNGDIVVTGFIPAERGGASDAWVARIDQSGRQLWSQRLGGNRRDEALDLAIAPDDSIVVAGWRDIYYEPATGSVTNGLVAKLGADGSVLWSVTIGEPERRISLSQVAILDGGEVLVGGRASVRQVSGSGAFLAKLDAAGSVLWTSNLASVATGQHVFESAAALNLHSDTTVELPIRNDSPGAGGATVRCVVISPESGKPAGGTCNGSAFSKTKRSVDGTSYSGGSIGGGYMGDPVFQKLASTGTLIWERILKSDEGDGLNSVATTSDGGVVGAGYAIVGERLEKHNWDALLIKLDVVGNEVWRRRFGGNSRDEFTSVAAMPNGSIIVAGYTGSQGASDWAPWVLRLDSSGALEGQAKAELERRQH